MRVPVGCGMRDELEAQRATDGIADGLPISLTSRPARPDSGSRRGGRAPRVATSARAPALAASHGSGGDGRLVWGAPPFPRFLLSEKPMAPATHRALQMTIPRIIHPVSRQAPTHTSANAATPMIVSTIGTHRPSMIAGIRSPAMIASREPVTSRSAPGTLVQRAPPCHSRWRRPLLGARLTGFRAAGDLGHFTAGKPAPDSVKG